MSRLASAVQPNEQRTLQAAVHAGFIISALLFIALYNREYISLVTFWAGSGLYQFALLIFPVSIILAWARRDWLTRTVAQPQPWALLPLLGLGLLWFVGGAANVNIFRSICAIVIWPALVYLFYGPRISRILLFPLAYLLLTIPFQHIAMNYLVVPLQTVTAHLAVFAMKWTSSLPVFMDGHFIETPAMTWHVAKACSGIKFSIATLAFGLLYAYLFFTSWRRRIIFVGVSIIVPIIANGLRVYFTILIGEHFGLQYATGTDHLIFGWQFFGTVLVLLFLSGWHWHQPPAQPPTRTDAPTVDNAVRRMRWLLPLSVVLIILPVAWYAASGHFTAQPMTDVPTQWPNQIAGWIHEDTARNDAHIVFQPYPNAQTLSTAYARGKQQIQVAYLSTGVGARKPELSKLPGRVYDPGEWRTIRSVNVASDAMNKPAFVEISLAARRGAARQSMLYAYRVGSHWTTSAVELKAWKTLYRLFAHSVPVGLLVVAASDETDGQQLRAVATTAADKLQ